MIQKFFLAGHSISVLPSRRILSLVFSMGLTLSAIGFLWGVFGWVGIAQAQTAIPFSSTFDCSESIQSTWTVPISGCGGWNKYGDWITTNGTRARISTLDNYPGGGGGRGFGQSVGDGSNNNGGGISLIFNPQTDFWVRYYMRVPLGFSWQSSEPQHFKQVRFRGLAGGGDLVLDWKMYPPSAWSFDSYGDGWYGKGGTCGWTCIMGGSTGDGKWHSYEVHVKTGSQGKIEGWVDGNLMFSINTPVYAPSGFDSVTIQDNQASPTNGTDVYVSWDDFVISNTGYIWPIGGSGGGDTTPPTSPTNLAASATSQSSITVSWTASTDNIGVDHYQVERCLGLSCSNFSQVGTLTSSPFVDSNLTDSTGYSYHIRAVDAAGNASNWSNVIGATTQSAIPAPTFTISANPTSIVSGQSSTLTWSTVTNATSCTASGGTFTGSESTSGGTRSVSPTATTTYMLSCTGTGGTTNQSATVTVTSGSSTLFFSEGYEDTNFSSRGWYDTTTGTVDAVEHHSGTSSLRCTYSASGNNCIAPSRHKFTESNGVYVSYWVKYSSNFVGSGKSYHPHEFLLLTNLNGDYDGLAFDYLTAYLESHWDSSSNGYIQAAFQDGQNIDQTKINQNLIGVTENRAVAGCNGSPSGYTGDCYNRGDGIYVNGTTLSSSQTFTSANKNGWNHVEAYYQLNTISSNMGQSDGIIRVWFNDALVLERTNAILRTAQRPTMKFNQFVFGPWIGDGSPVTQTMWIDDLEVRDSRPSTTSPTFSSCSTVTPTNFTDPTYTGYGAPYDVFASNTPLISTQCSSTDTHTLTATLGIPGDTTRIVYTKGYYYDPGINDWTSFTGTCTGALNGEWCQGSVATSITDTDISTASAADPSYLVGFTCRSQNGSWKCGCRDTACANFYWQVQGGGM